MQKVLVRGIKHWEKEKLVVLSNFSFSLSVFKRLVLQTRKNQGLFGKGLRALPPFHRHGLYMYISNCTQEHSEISTYCNLMRNSSCESKKFSGPFTFGISIWKE